MAATKSFTLLALGATLSLAYTYPPIPSDKSTPVGIRLAIAGPNSMNVGWSTYEQLSQPCVQYGTTSGSYSSKACSSNSITYPSSRSWFNAVTLTGLTPATTYYYKIVSTNSTEGQFLAPRTPGDTTPFEASVVVDLGVYGPDGFTTQKRSEIPTVQPSLQQETIGSLATNYNNYEFIIHPGDFAYADDWYLNIGNIFDPKDAYEAILEQFYYQQLAPITQGKPYMASPGNHEADCEELDYTTGLCPEGQKNFTDFMVRFGHTMPSPFASSSSSSTAQSLAKKAQSLANPPFWYSFEYGMAHITMIDTETDFPSAPDGPSGSAGLDGGPFGAPNQQLNFLDADLASVDRTKTPWLIVAGHRPWYSTGGSSNNCTTCQAAFEPYFYKYGVDLAIFGHVHNSQRFQPVYRGVPDPAGLQNPKAPMYIVAGGAGNIEGLSSVGSEPSYTAFAYADDWSYANLQFHNKSYLGVQFVQSKGSVMLDQSTLYKAHNQQFVVQS